MEARSNEAVASNDSAAEHKLEAANDRSVPQQDRIAKKRAWEMLQNLPKMHPLHITSGTDFKWWLWVANLAQHSEFELGAGITGAVVTECDRYAVTVVFTRVDSSQCTVTLQWHYNQGYVYYLS